MKERMAGKLGVSANNMKEPRIHFLASKGIGCLSTKEECVDFESSKDNQSQGDQYRQR